jgi:hypothetical protein
VGDEPIEQDAVLDGDAPDPALALAAGTGRTGNVPLAVLAGVLTAVAGVLLWTLLARYVREFAGLSVLTGLTVGYVLRVVSGRTTVPVRVAAALIVAVACVAGTVTSTRAVLARTIPEQIPGSHISFTELMKNFDYGKTFTVVQRQGALPILIYVAAVVIAYLAAGPQKPAKGKAQPVEEPFEEPLDEPSAPAGTD